MKNPITEKYKIFNGVTFPCSIVGLGTIDLNTHPIEVIDEWYTDGKLAGVLELKKTAKSVEVPVAKTKI
jgi:hypothetical protein